MHFRSRAIRLSVQWFNVDSIHFYPIQSSSDIPSSLQCRALSSQVRSMDRYAIGPLVTTESGKVLVACMRRRRRSLAVFVSWNSSCVLCALIEGFRHRKHQQPSLKSLNGVECSGCMQSGQNFLVHHIPLCSSWWLGLRKTFILPQRVRQTRAYASRCFAVPVMASADFAFIAQQHRCHQTGKGR